MAIDTPLVVAASRQLPGVLDVEADRAADGGLARLRIRLVPGAAWTDVEAAVRRLLQAGDPTASGVPVVLQPDEPTPITAVPAQIGSRPLNARPRVGRLDVSTVGSQATVVVELTAGERSLVGRCSALVSGNGLPRAVATATVRALQEVVGDAAQLGLEHVEVTTGRTGPLALVQLALVGPTGTQLLAGAAVVRHDPNDAVVRAVLDASNRRVGALLSA